MSEPRIPGQGHDATLPCGVTVDVHEFDLNTRAIECECGERHAVVQDVHPPTRFVPEELVEILRQTVEADDAFEEFTTAHLMGMAIEEFPDDISTVDCSEHGAVGFGLVWISTFDDRRLHEIVVELLLELMDHAVSHADDEGAMERFERQLEAFEIEEFVEEYRDQRGFEQELERSS